MNTPLTAKLGRGVRRTTLKKEQKAASAWWTGGRLDLLRVHHMNFIRSPCTGQQKCPISPHHAALSPQATWVPIR